MLLYTHTHIIKQNEKTNYRVRDNIYKPFICKKLISRTHNTQQNKQ